MRTVMTGVLVLSLGVAGAGCDLIGGGDKKDGGGKAESGDKAAAKPDAAADSADKAKFIKAYVAAACAVKTSKDLSKAVELTRSAYEKHGFNQMSYAAATKKWAMDPEVQKAQKEGMSKCAPPAAEGDAKPAEGDAAKPAEGDQAKPAEGDAKPAEGDAAKPAEGDAKTAEGDAKPAAEGDKKADKKAEAPKASAHAGKWAGAMTSKDVSATVSFVVKDDGSVAGIIKGKKPKSFSVVFDGMAKASGSFQLNGRKKGAPHQAFLRGTVDKKGVVVGKWDGTIAKKRAKGTWRAAKAK